MSPGTGVWGLGIPIQSAQLSSCLQKGLNAARQLVHSHAIPAAVRVPLLALLAPALQLVLVAVVEIDDQHASPGGVTQRNVGPSGIPGPPAAFTTQSVCRADQRNPPSLTKGWPH